MNQKKRLEMTVTVTAKVMVTAIVTETVMMETQGLSTRLVLMNLT